MSSIWAALQALINAPLTWAEAAPIEKQTGWGQLPLTSVTAAIGVGLLAQSYLQARLASSWSVPLFWIGLVTLLAPIIARFAMRNVSRRESVGMILVLAAGIFLGSYLRSPLLFSRFDEFPHLRTAYDMLQNQRLFTPNSLLPVSPFYPGLESATTALVNLTGLSIFDASVLVLGTCRLVTLLGLYLLFEQLSHSARVAGLATAIYMGSSTFMFFNAQFGYESLALPLAIMSVYMLVRRSALTGTARLWLTVSAALVLFAIVPTHHITTYMLIAFLWGWTLVELYARRQGDRGASPFWLAVWLTLVGAWWIGMVAPVTTRYLGPLVTDAFGSVLNLVTGQGAARTLFENSAGQSAVLFERVIAIGSVLLLAVGLPLGLWQWWLRYRRQASPTILALCALVYPALPVMRLTNGAWEASNRLSSFVFIAVGFIVALGLAQLPLPTRWSHLRQWIIVPSVTIIFLGGVVAGSSPQTRLPGPYRPAAEERSIDNENILAAEWARTVLGPNNRMAADRTHTIITGAYGAQRMIVDLSDSVSISGLFLKYELTDNDRMLIYKARLRYLLVDRRITQALPILGYYFEKWEQLVVSYTPPISPVVLEKYDHLAGVSRIFDSGDIVIYDIGALAHAP